MNGKTESNMKSSTTPKLTAHPTPPAGFCCPLSRVHCPPADILSYYLKCCGWPHIGLVMHEDSCLMSVHSFWRFRVCAIWSFICPTLCAYHHRTCDGPPCQRENPQQPADYGIGLEHRPRCSAGTLHLHAVTVERYEQGRLILGTV